MVDVAPWIVWGNSPDDTTTPAQRVWAFLPDAISKPIEEAYSYVQQE